MSKNEIMSDLQASYISIKCQHLQSLFVFSAYYAISSQKTKRTRKKKKRKERKKKKIQKEVLFATGK